MKDRAANWEFWVSNLHDSLIQPSGPCSVNWTLVLCCQMDWQEGNVLMTELILTSFCLCRRVDMIFFCYTFQTAVLWQHCHVFQLWRVFFVSVSAEVIKVPKFFAQIDVQILASKSSNKSTGSTCTQPAVPVLFSFLHGKVSLSVCPTSLHLLQCFSRYVFRKPQNWKYNLCWNVGSKTKRMSEK